MNSRQKTAHMKVAHIYAKLSYCKRRQVGCIIVEGDRVISIGYNGTPPNSCNCCENEDGLTKPEVIHAEDNALRKLKKYNYDLSHASLFVTCAPCPNCAGLIVNSGIKHVVYNELYKNDDGINILINNGIIVESLNTD
jgi:dCMP deaminase